MSFELARFCKSKEIKDLAKLDMDTLDSLLDLSIQRYNYIHVRKRSTANTVIDFCDPFISGYMTRIAHKRNTCFIAASVWLFGTLRFLVKLMYYNKEIISPSLISIVNAVFPMYDIHNRPMFDDIHACVLYPEYKKNTQDDLTMNMNAILDRINPKLLDQAVVNYNTITKFKLVDVNGSVINSLNIMKVYINRYKTERSKVSKMLSDNAQALNVFERMFPSDIRISRTDMKNILVDFSRVLRDKHPENSTTLERFLKQDPDSQIKKNIGKLNYAYTNASRILSYINESENISNKVYVNTLKIIEHRSVQDFLDYTHSPKVDINIITDDNPIVYSRKTVTVNVYTRSYIIIMLSFGKSYTLGSFDINDIVKIGDVEYMLTSAGCKSGDISTGHWWTLVKTDNNTFVKYDDISTISRVKSLYSNGGMPAVLIYTKNPEYI